MEPRRTDVRRYGGECHLLRPCRGSWRFWFRLPTARAAGYFPAPLPGLRVRNHFRSYRDRELVGLRSKAVLLDCRKENLTVNEQPGGRSGPRLQSESSRAGTAARAYRAAGRAQGPAPTEQSRAGTAARPYRAGPLGRQYPRSVLTGNMGNTYVPVSSSLAGYSYAKGISATFH